MNIKKFLKIIDYKITGGTYNSWDCFDSKTNYIICEENGYEINAICSWKDDKIYVIEVWDYIDNVEYRWVSNSIKEKYELEHTRRGINYDNTYDDNNFINVTNKEIQEKIQYYMRGR